jgi:uncharacterized protein DUF2845
VRLIVPLTLLVLLTSGPARAADDTFRCGGKIINTGMAMVDVLAKCGEPTLRTVEEIPQQVRRANGSTYTAGTVTVEVWTYDRGSSSFPAVLRFEGGKVTSIEIVRP